MKWHFIRHGEIHSNTQNVYAGWNDEQLTQRGIQQAEDAGRKASSLKIDTVYYSPLKRTEQTAQIIRKQLDCTLIPDDSFIEFRLGPWEGLSESEVAKFFPEKWALWNTFPADLNLPGRETLKELQDRVLLGLAAIQNGCGQSQSILIVTHVAIIRVVQLHHDNRDLNAYKKIPVDNGSIFSFNSLKLDHLQ